MEGWGAVPPPFHYIVYDKAGNSLVIEPLDGKLVTYDNPLGVCTNSPTFDWHMTNLRNYVNLSPDNASSTNMAGVEIAPLGQGSGLLGLPGDFTPPSRFVRAAIFSKAAIPPNNTEEAVLQIFHILNQFDIPVGSVRAVVNGVIHTESTTETSVKAPQSLKYYFKMYEDQSIRVVDLNQFDLNAKEIKKAPMSGRELITDVSSSLK